MNYELNRSLHASISFRAIDIFPGISGKASCRYHPPLESSERCRCSAPSAYSAVNPTIRPQG